MSEIYEAIVRSGKSIAEISKLSNILSPNLSRFMSKNGNPTLETLQKIADATGQTIVISPKNKVSSSSNFTTTKAWLRHSTAGINVILNKTSALEYMGLFSGYSGEDSITGYANYNPDIEGLDITVKRIPDSDIEGCTTTFSRTVNDILESDEDRQPLIEALSEWMIRGNKEPEIKKENIKEYEEIKKAAEEYYDEGYAD